MELPIPRIQKNKSLLSLIIAVVFLFFLCLSIFVGALVYQNYLISLEEKEATAVSAMAKAAKPVDMPTALRTSTVKQVTKQKSVPSYSSAQLLKLDLRKPSGLTASDLKLVTSAGLVGLEEAFVEAERKYGVNCIFLMSIASEESAKGTMMFRPNNMFGYGRSGFSSKAEGIHVVARALSSKYLKPGGSLYGGSPTIGGVRQRYCTSTTWPGKVARYMSSYYAVISDHREDALKNLE